jgi:Rps23 Pro-64 3,4-dihydroxylase Tpa1-like proline 4-hydroxylase
MIYIEDDFLTEEQFTALKNKVDSHYSPIEPRELFDNYDFKNEPDKYILPIARSGDWLDSCIPNAPQCIPALKKMEETLINQGVQELKNWSSWFQYSVDTMSLPPHRDQAVRKSLPKDTYTAVIYTSDWKPNWGGEFVVGSPVFNDEGLVESLTDFTHSIEPKPNRMVIWSREEWHMVNALTVNDPNYVRSFFGTSWSSIESKGHDQNPFQRFYFTAET